VNRTLLLRLDGPIQSWCEQLMVEASPVVFPTGCELIGVIGTAMEFWRDEQGEGLEFFHAAVRADEKGRGLDDFQASGRRRKFHTTPSGDPRVKALLRPFIVDAVFTAAVTGPAGAIEQAAAALARPRRQIFLGRRCCPPAAPILLGLSDRPTLEALSAVPYQGHRSGPPDAYPVAMYTRSGVGPAAAPPCDGGSCGGSHGWLRTDLVIAPIPQMRGAARSDDEVPQRTRPKGRSDG
jgi:CRISPR system Cascade subunit CasD